MQVVRGHVQTYDWGPVDGLSRWTPASGAHQAELWFGSHPNGPSPLRDGPGGATQSMPILTKLLAAERPLSIQIHPPAAMARAQYDVQQADPGAPRLLADPYAKAEILIALEPFVILEGFRDPARSAQIFGLLGPGLQPAADALASGDVRSCVRSLLTLGIDDVFSNAAALREAFGQAGMPEHDARVIHDVVHYFPGDPGVFVAALLTARTVAPGQAVYVDPGTVHAYVRGTGIEVMNSSDNVLRLGLTTKTIAVDAALAAMSVQAQPHLVAARTRGGISTYAPDGAPFVVHDVRDDLCETLAGAARIVVCLTGRVVAGDTTLSAGEGLLLGADDPGLTVRADGRAVISQHVG